MIQNIDRLFLVLGKSPFGWASRSHFWPSQRMVQSKLKKNWLGQIFPIMAGQRVEKNLTQP